MCYEDAAKVIDPWLISERSEIGPTLLESTRITSQFGEANLGNLLWAIDIQTVWQINTLRQQSDPSSKRIDEYSWYSCMNYFLTVVPYLAAIGSNILPLVEFLPPQSNSQDKFPIIYEKIDPVIATAWTDYFDNIKRLQIDPTYPVSIDYLQRLLWTAHNCTVALTSLQIQQEMEMLNVKEESFATGFAHFVELLAIFNVNTSYSTMDILKEFFPQRKLTVLDTPPLILDMTPEQNALISSFFSITAMVQVPLTWTLFVNTLRNGMDIVNCAANLQQTLMDFLTDPTDDLIVSLKNVADLLC